jgi:asparagine synthase (glutamine-hydrolysing)
MCGICGKLNFDLQQPVSPDLIRAMMGSIRHRGPDDEGLYISSGVGLGHRRLSIIDLNTGRQPISNEDSAIWIVFNGEIYNYKELRSQLLVKGHKFRTATDTEVIVHLYEEFGTEAIQKLRGMFSFALWDSKQQMLLLARDRVGIKPLYYNLTQKSLIFGSEVKAILADPSVAAEADPEALDRFLMYRYVPGEETLFKGIRKLEPGHYMTVKDGKSAIRQYWDLSFGEPSDSKSSEDLEAELSELLAQTVQDHMIADVPVGVLLSGGVDSTAMLSFATDHTDKQISTFTVGFDGQQCADERPFATLAAERFGTTHHDMTITASEFLRWLPSYLWHMEEPVCEPPAIALYYVTKLAREHVTVLLSGEGGDEAFAGYQNYRNLFWLETFKRGLGRYAGALAGMMAAAGGLYKMGKIQRYASLMTIPFENYYYSRTADPLQFFSQHKSELYTSEFRKCTSGNGYGNARHSMLGSQNEALNVLDQMLYIDTKTWLPDDLLIKADKMTMANSLELRVPFLDHRVLEFAARLPRRCKVRGWTTKYLLKRALADRVPREIVKRKKTGFPVPYQSWIRNEFRSVFRTLLTEQRTVERGYFRRHEIETLLDSNCNGTDLSKEIFSLVVLELWHRTFIDRASVSLN